MKKTVVFILVLALCLTAIFSALAINQNQCSHPKKILTQKIVNDSYARHFTVTNCPNGHDYPHTFYQTGTCTREIWRCVTCGKPFVNESNIKITKTYCGN